MARPFSNDKDKKKKRIDLGFTLKEIEIYKKAADKLGIDLRAFFRLAIREKATKIIKN